MVNRKYLPGGITIARTYRGQPGRGRRPTAVRAPARAKPAAAVRLPGVARAVARAGTRRAARGTAWCRGRRQGGKGLADVVKAVANNPYAQEVGKRLFGKGNKLYTGFI